MDNWYDNFSIGDTFYQRKVGISYIEDYVNTEMENKGLTPEAQLSEKIFSDVVKGLYTDLRDRANRENDKITSAFVEEFKSRLTTKLARTKQKEYEELQELESNLSWFASRAKIVKRKKELINEVVKLLDVEFYHSYSIGTYITVKEDNERSKLTYVEYPTESVVRAKLRVVPDYLTKSYNALIKIVE